MFARTTTLVVWPPVFAVLDTVSTTGIPGVAHARVSIVLAVRVIGAFVSAIVPVVVMVVVAGVVVALFHATSIAAVV